MQTTKMMLQSVVCVQNAVSCMFTLLDSVTYYEYFTNVSPVFHKKRYNRSTTNQ